MDERLKKYLMEKYQIDPLAEEQTRDTADELDLMSGLAKAGNMIGSAMGRQKADATYGSELSSQAESLRKGIDTGRARKIQEAGLMKEAQASDPTSDISNKYRQAVGKIASKAGLDVNTLSAEEIDKLFPYAKASLDMEGQRRQQEMAAMDRAERQQIKLEEQKEKDLQNLMKQVGETQGVKEKLGRSLDTLDKEDVAGIGRIKNILPNFVLSDEGQANRQDIQGVVADLLKIQSGTAVSDKEVARKMNEMGMAAGSDIETLRRGIRNLAKDTAAKLKAKEAGFRPEVVEEYKKRGGISSSDLVNLSGGEQQPAKTSEIRRKTPDGRIAIFDAVTKEFIRYE